MHSHWAMKIPFKNFGALSRRLNAAQFA